MISDLGWLLYFTVFGALWIWASRRPIPSSEIKGHDLVIALRQKDNEIALLRSALRGVPVEFEPEDGQ